MIVVPLRRACLKNVEATGWFAVELLPVTIATSALLDVAEGRGDRAGADPLEQRRHAGGVAQPGAVVDVVGVEAGADELLEEVGLLVRALRAAEPGDGGRAAFRVDLGQPARDEVQRLFPGRLPEVRQHLGVVDQAAGLAAALAALALLAFGSPSFGHPVVVALGRRHLAPAMSPLTSADSAPLG